jgi:hypothetical protein
MSTISVFLAMILPGLLLGRAVTRELAELYQTLNPNGPAGTNLALRWLEHTEQWINAFVRQRRIHELRYSN